MNNQPYSPGPHPQKYAQYPDPGYGPSNASDDTIRSSNMGGAYVQSQHENYVDPAGNRIDRREEVFEDKNQSRANLRYWLSTVIYFILGVIEVIMLLRLIFRFLGANESNGFITFLYSLSHVFVGAFNGIFNDQSIGTNGVFEVSTIIAMLVCALIGWGLVSLARVIFAPNVTGRQSSITTRRNRLS